MGILFERLRQKYRTMPYPDGPAPELPERWLGMPEVDAARLRAGGGAPYCPTGAIDPEASRPLDVGRCIFCGACAVHAPEGAVRFTRNHAMAAFSREELLLGTAAAAREAGAEVAAKEERLAMIRRTFGQSFKLRQVSAGGCNACEADANVLGTLAWDMGRFGISFVASPRHADGVLVTGPVTDNMRLALEKTWNAIPTPKVVIAAGACAISGGLYGDSEGGGRDVLDGMLPVDLYVPGCPPHPLVLLEGLLRLLGRLA